MSGVPAAIARYRDILLVLWALAVVFAATFGFGAN